MTVLQEHWHAEMSEEERLAASTVLDLDAESMTCPACMAMMVSSRWSTPVKSPPLFLLYAVSTPISSDLTMSGTHRIDAIDGSQFMPRKRSSLPGLFDNRGFLLRYNACALSKALIFWSGVIQAGRKTETIQTCYAVQYRTGIVFIFADASAALI